MESVPVIFWVFLTDQQCGHSSSVSTRLIMSQFHCKAEVCLHNYLNWQRMTPECLTQTNNNTSISPDVRWHADFIQGSFGCPGKPELALDRKQWKRERWRTSLLKASPSFWTYVNRFCNNLKWFAYFWLIWVSVLTKTQLFPILVCSGALSERCFSVCGFRVLYIWA